jgi:hypothetical protein
MNEENLLLPPLYCLDYCQGMKLIYLARLTSGTFGTLALEYWQASEKHRVVFSHDPHSIATRDSLQIKKRFKKLIFFWFSNVINLRSMLFSKVFSDFLLI